MVFFSVYTKLKKRSCKSCIIYNKMLCFILKLGPRSHISDEELKTVGMLKVEDRVKQLKLNHVFKIYSEVAPEYLNSHFTKLINIPCNAHRFNTGAVQLFFLFQKFRANSAILFSILVIGNGKCYQLKLKAVKLIFDLKIQSKATFYHN